MSEEKPKQRFYYGYIIVIATTLIWTAGWGTFGTFGVFYRPIIEEFGWSRADAVLGFSLAVVVQGIGAVVAGWLCDRIGPKIVALVIGSFLGLSYLILSQVNYLWQFNIAYALILAIGISAITAPSMSTIARWFVKKRGLMTGIAQTGAGGGLILCPITAWLIVSYGWRNAYIVLGILTLALNFIAGSFLRRDPKDIGLSPDGDDGVAIKEDEGRQLNFKAMCLSLRDASKDANFWIIAGIYCAFGFLRSTYTSHIAAHVQDLGFSLVQGASVLASLQGASIAGRVAMGRVIDIIGSRKATIISYLVIGIIMAWALITTDLWGLYLFAIVFGFLWGAQAVLRFSVTSEAYSLSSLGALMGVLLLGESLAAFLGTYFSGYIFDFFGNYDLTFGLGIAIAVIAVILSFRLKPAANKMVS